MAWEKFTPVLKVREWLAGGCGNGVKCAIFRLLRAQCLCKQQAVVLPFRAPATILLRPDVTTPADPILAIILTCPSVPAPPQEIEERGVQPELYPYGSRGPVGAHYLAAKHGVRWGDLAADDE